MIRTMGRPSSYSDQIAGEICRRLATGEPMARICRDDDMPGYTTVMRWEQDNEEFRLLSMRAKQNGTHFLADDALRIADDESIDTNRAKLMIDTRLRLIGKWNAKAYGDKNQVELSGADGGPVATVTRIELVAGGGSDT
jgi:hypothetical protein